MYIGTMGRGPERQMLQRGTVALILVLEAMGYKLHGALKAQLNVSDALTFKKRDQKQCTNQAIYT